MRRSLTQLVLGAALVAWGAGAAFGRHSTDELAALIEAASPGESVLAPEGVFHGHLRITNPIVLDGGGRTIIDGGGEGTVVEILVADVTLRGLTVRGSGARVSGEPAGIRATAGPVTIENNHLEDVLFGIDLKGSAGSVVRGNTVRGKPLDPGRRGDGIRLWWSHECVIEHNDVRDSRDVVIWYSEGVGVRVVSLPSWELFERQDTEYRQSVLPAGARPHSFGGDVRCRMTRSQGVAFGWSAQVRAIPTC